MKTKVQANLRMAAASLAILIAATTATVFAQQPNREQRQEVRLGSGMSILAPGLMEIGAKTNLFLALAEKIPVTAEQRKKLEDLVFGSQMDSFQRETDLDVADAELKRLLTRDNIDLGAVRAKMKEIEGIRGDADMKKIETLLQAISLLTHEQHTRIILLAREPEELSKPRQQVY